MRFFNRYYPTYRLLLPLVDLILAVLIAGAGRLLVDFAEIPAGVHWLAYVLQGGLVGILVVTVFYYSDLYSIDSTLPEKEWAVRLVSSFGITCLVLGGLSYILPRPALREISLTTMLLIGIGLFRWRIEFTEILKRRRVFGKVLIGGTQTIGRIIAEELFRWKHRDAGRRFRRLPARQYGAFLWQSEAC